MGQVIRSRPLTTTWRWTARFIAAALWLIVLAFAIADRLDDTSLTPSKAVMIAALGATWVGFAATWFVEPAGGAMVVMGMMALCFGNLAFSGCFHGGWVFPLFSGPGILACVSWWLDHRPPAAAHCIAAGGNPRRPKTIAGHMH